MWNSSSKKQIFFLHYAGGNSFSYNFLSDFLKQYEVHQLELPGRGKRIKEELLNCRKSAIADFTQQILRQRNGSKFMIYGHSMGAALGLDVVQQLEERGVFPELLMVSGSDGPGVGENKQRYLMDKKEFLEELRIIGGMPADFFEHDDLVDFYLPILKADFRICEAPADRFQGTIHTPIIALMGHLETDKEYINNWRQYTKASFDSTIFAGNHFFIYEYQDLLSNLIVRSFD